MNLQMKAIFTLLPLVWTSLVGCAQMGAVVGYNHTNASNTVGLTNSPAGGFEFGYATKSQLRNPEVYFRTGLEITKRSLIVETAGLKGLVDIGNMEVPMIYQYRPNDSRFYFGGGVRINLSTDSACKIDGQKCELTGVTSNFLLGEVELGYALDDRVEVTLFGQTGAGKIYDGAENLTSYGLRLIYFYSKTETDKKIKNFQNR